MSDNIAPWERQENESAQAFEAFVNYRDAGPDRSVRATARNLGKSGTLIAEWSSKKGWVARVAAWENEQDRLERLENRKAIREMAKRHANQAMLMQQKVIERLRNLNPDELSPADIRAWYDTAVKVERLARGEPTEATRLSGDAENPLRVGAVSEVDIRVLADPISRELALRLFERAHGVADLDAGEHGDDGGEGSVGSGPAPGCPE